MNRDLVLPIIWIFILILYMVLFFATAKAHEDGHQVYDYECCYDKDCAPVILMEPEGEDGTWMTTKHGKTFISKTGEFLKKQSMDERFHVCAINGRPLCVYYPAQY